MWLQEEIMGREEVHVEDGLIHVRHYEGPGKAAGRSEVKTELGTTGDDRGVVSGQEFATCERLETAIYLSGRYNTQLNP